jgi:hypothetical protein
MRLVFPANVGPKGAIVSGAPGTELDGVELTIPSGALDAMVQIDARVIADEPALGPTGYGVGPTFLFTPDGRTLAQAATVKLPLYRSRVADLEQTPADCRAWLRSGTTWSQVAQSGSGDDWVQVPLSALGAAAAGAVLKSLSTTVPAGAPCTDPLGFCVTPLSEGLLETSSQYSSIAGGKLYAWRTRTTTTGLAGVVTEYDVAAGKLTRTSLELEYPSSSTQTRPAISDADQRVALAADGTAWVALPNGIAHLSFTDKGTYLPETVADTRTVAVVFTADGTRHRVRLTANKAGTIPASLSISSTSGTTEPTPVEFDRATGAWVSDQLPVTGLKDTLGYAFPIEKNRVGSLTPPKTVLDLTLPAALTDAVRTSDPPDELAFSVDGEVMALSLQKPDAQGRSLWLQSRSGSISRGIAGLGNLAALEFGSDGTLWAAPAGLALVYRIVPTTGAVSKVPLTDAAFGTADYKANLPLALRSFTFPASSGSPARPVLFVITAGLVRGVVRVEPSAAAPMTDGGSTDGGSMDAGTSDGGVDAGSCTAGSCLNGGTCPATGVCLCPATSTGDRCQFDTDECAAYPSPCGSGSLCTNTDGGYTCACLPGMSSPTSDGRSCSTAGKAVELIAFYDDSIDRLWGDQAGPHIDELVRLAAATYEANTFTPAFKITLEAVVPLTPAPAAITYRSCATPDPSRPACVGCWAGMPPVDCSMPLSTLAGEVDTVALLGTFLQFAQAHRSSLIRFDDALLFTTRDFASSTLELASEGALCTAQGGAVLQVQPDGTAAFNASLVAHALGHNLNMSHDTVAGFVMSPSFSDPPSTVFSSASISAANAFLGTATASCINDGGASAWATTRCHDGRVDPTEQCDPGPFADSCCSASCQLVPGCSCPASDPCCAGGTLVDAGVSCRPADAPCDAPDVCDGVSSKCPDRLLAPGAPCGDGGVCYRDACRSRDEECAAVNGGTVATGQCTMPISTSCAALSCRLTSGTCVTFSGLDLEGLACGAGSQCVAGACQASSSLGWNWRVDPFGPCLNSVKRRSVICENVAGATGPDALCPQPKPVTALNCP